MMVKNANFHNNGVPKQGSHCVCLRVVLVCSDFKMSKIYYWQVFQKIVKVFQKKIR